MKNKNYVVMGLIGTALDSGTGPERWEKWRPTVALCRHENLLIHRLELFYQAKFSSIVDVLVEDIKTVSPETTVHAVEMEFDDPWDFEEVYSALHEFAGKYEFNTDEEEYLIHITTGTHVAQICMFLLTESRHFPAKLLQTSPPNRHKSEPGKYTIIDLDLSKYDEIASRSSRKSAKVCHF